MERKKEGKKKKKKQQQQQQQQTTRLSAAAAGSGPSFWFGWLLLLVNGGHKIINVLCQEPLCSRKWQGFVGRYMNRYADYFISGLFPDSSGGDFVQGYILSVLLWPFFKPHTELATGLTPTWKIIEIRKRGPTGSIAMMVLSILIPCVQSTAKNNNYVTFWIQCQQVPENQQWTSSVWSCEQVIGPRWRKLKWRWVNFSLDL